MRVRMIHAVDEESAAYTLPRTAGGLLAVPRHAHPGFDVAHDDTPSSIRGEHTPVENSFNHARMPTPAIVKLAAMARIAAASAGSPIRPATISRLRGRWWPTPVRDRTDASGKRYAGKSRPDRIFKGT